MAAYRRGIFNRYRKGMPLTEMIVKDAAIAIGNLWRLINGREIRRMLVYPHYPSRGSTIYQIARKLGYEVTNKMARRHDIAIYWEYATIRSEWHALEEINGARVINLHSRNIAKDFIDEKMREVFSYATRIDPLRHDGVAVQKSLTNAVHDGLMVQCPLHPESGFIYQRLVDSGVNEREVMDLRVVVMAGAIPHIYLNYRVKEERFKNVPDRAELCMDPSTMLTEEEQTQIIRFCEITGLEFCELDVLRDRNDGRIYIVDANNTPQGPPKHLARAEKRRALDSMAGCFRNQFLQ